MNRVYQDSIYLSIYLYIYQECLRALWKIILGNSYLHEPAEWVHRGLLPRLWIDSERSSPSDEASAIVMIPPKVLHMVSEGSDSD